MTKTLLALASAILVLAGPLGFRMPAGDSFALQLTYWANVPTQGVTQGTVDTRAKVEAELPDARRLGVDIALTGYALAMGVDVSPTGLASNITGVDMTNEKDAIVARNVASLGLPALPDAPVSIGTTWESERNVYLPKTSVPGVPQIVRVRFTYTVKGFAAADGRELVNLAVVGKHPAGQSVKIACSGYWNVDANTGKPISAAIEGEASMRVLITEMKLPFKLSAKAP
jgi:hypothetical protein